MQPACAHAIVPITHRAAIDPQRANPQRANPQRAGPSPARHLACATGVRPESSCAHRLTSSCPRMANPLISVTNTLPCLENPEGATEPSHGRSEAQPLVKTALYSITTPHSAASPSPTTHGRLASPADSPRSPPSGRADDQGSLAIKST